MSTTLEPMTKEAIVAVIMFMKDMKESKTACPQSLEEAVNMIGLAMARAENKESPLETRMAGLLMAAGFALAGLVHGKIAWQSAVVDEAERSAEQSSADGRWKE